MSADFFVSHIIVFVYVILNVCRNTGLQHVQPAQRTTTELLKYPQREKLRQIMPLSEKMEVIKKLLASQRLV